MRHFKNFSLLIVTSIASCLLPHVVQAATPPQVLQNTKVHVSDNTNNSEMQTARSVPVLIVEERSDNISPSAKSTDSIKKRPVLIPETSDEQSNAELDKKNNVQEEKTQLDASGEAKGNTLNTDKKDAKPKTKPKRKLIEAPPASQQFMRTPQTSDFVACASPVGYTINLPISFGDDKLAGYVQGPMLLRAKNDNLYCAIIVLDETNTESYLAATALPSYEDKKIWWKWVMNTHPTTTHIGTKPTKTSGIWNCTLGTYSDFIGEKVILQAETQIAGKTYQQLYVMPADDMYTLLPQAMQSLTSMKIQ